MIHHLHLSSTKEHYFNITASLTEMKYRDPYIQSCPPPHSPPHGRKKENSKIGIGKGKLSISNRFYTWSKNFCLTWTWVYLLAKANPVVTRWDFEFEPLTRFLFFFLPKQQQRIWANVFKMLQQRQLVLSFCYISFVLIFKSVILLPFPPIGALWFYLAINFFTLKIVFLCWPVTSMVSAATKI